MAQQANPQAGQKGKPTPQNTPAHPVITNAGQQKTNALPMQTAKESVGQTPKNVYIDENKDESCNGDSPLEVGLINQRLEPVGENSNFLTNIMNNLS